MTNEQILCAFYSYYTIGLVIAAILVGMDAYGQFWLAPRHPEFFNGLPRKNNLFISFFQHLLAWPITVAFVSKKGALIYYAMKKRVKRLYD